MSCQHGNPLDACDECDALLAEFRSGIKQGREEGWEACEACHCIVDGKHMGDDNQKHGNEMTPDERFEADEKDRLLDTVSELRQQLAKRDAEIAELKIVSDHNLATYRQAAQKLRDEIAEMKQQSARRLLGFCKCGIERDELRKQLAMMKERYSKAVWEYYAHGPEAIDAAIEATEMKP